jgi:hypothetical protein
MGGDAPQKRIVREVTHDAHRYRVERMSATDEDTIGYNVFTTNTIVTKAIASNKA